MKRQKDKRIKKDRKERVNIEKAKQISTGLSIAKWLESLSKEESELCGTLIQEYTKSHVSDFSMAFMEILENFLIDEKYQERSEIMNEFTEQLVITGKKMFKIEKMGGDYYMSLNRDKENIINDFKEKIKKGMPHEEAIEDIYIKYNKYSKSSLKNIIKTSVKTEQKEDNCLSNSCPYKKDKKCTNSHVLSKEKSCINFNEEQKAINIKDKAIEYFNNNKDKSREEVIYNLAEELNSKKVTIERYYRTWIKENAGISINEDKKKQSIINEDFEREVQDMINSSRGEKEMSKFKVLKKVVVLDLEGQYGQYHIEDNTVTVADKVYKSIADVDNEFKAEEDELTKKLIELRKSKEEIKELFNEYMSE